MTRKKSSKRKESVIVDESIYSEIAEVEVVEEIPAVSKVLEASISDTDLAKKLKGHPKVFGTEYQSALKRLVEEGIAADFGDQGHARGYKWRQAVK